MSKSEIDTKLISDGTGLDGSTFLDTLAFNGQCFLLNGAEQLQNTPQIIGSGVQKIPFHSHGRAEHRHRSAYQDAHSARSGRTSAGSGPKSPFAPIITVAGNNNIIDLGLNKLLPNHGPHMALMNLTPEQASLMIPYIKLYKVEYGIKYDNLDFDKANPLPDSNSLREIPIKFDTVLDVQDHDDIYYEKSGRLGGVGLKRFSWQLKGVNPAEADKNIEAQVEIYFNNVDEIFKDQNGAWRQDIEPGYASILSLLVHSPPIGETHDATSVTHNAVPRPNHSHLLYDGKFFEVKAVVGWTTQAPKKGVTPEEQIFYDSLEDLKTVLYMTLTDHRFTFDQDGSATLNINFRARSALKEMDHDVTGTSRYQFANDKKKELVTRARARTAGDPYSGTDDELFNLVATGIRNRDTGEIEKNPQAAEIKKELDKISRTRYSDIVKNVPKYVAWARPEQLKLFETDHAAPADSGTTESTHAMALWASLSSGELQEGDTGPLTPGHQPDNSNVDGLGNLKGESKLEVYKAPEPWGKKGRALGIVPEGLHEEYWNSGAATSRTISGGSLPSPMVVSGDVEGAAAGAQSGAAYQPDPKASSDFSFYFKIDMIEPLSSPYMPLYDGAYHSTATSTIDGVAEHMLPTNDEDVQELQEDSMVSEMNSTVALASVFEADQITFNNQGWTSRSSTRAQRFTRRADRVPVVFMYLGDILWSIISGTAGVKKDFETKTVGMIACPLRYPKPAKFYSRMGVWRSDANTKSFSKRFKLGKKALTKEELKDFFFDLNIASIPIQFDLFLAWLQRKIVAADRDYYFFENFLTDIINDLVNPIIGGRCLPSLSQLGCKISHVPLTLDSDGLFVQENTPQTPLPRQRDWDSTPSYTLTTKTQAEFATHVDASALQSQILKTTPNINETKGPPGHTTFKVLVSTDVDPLKSGNEEADARNNIWHFKVGRDRGPVKEVTFDRVDVPMMREARINRTSTAGAWQLRELYNTTVKLMGFPGITPGQTVYVVPNIHMFGSPTNKNSMARLLGIGGYHLVVSTQSEISPGNYSTTIKALHEALPKLAEGLEDQDTSLQPETPLESFFA